MYIDADDATLARFDSVEYVLHPTFTPPVRKSYDRQTKFGLSSNGWGEFKIYVKVFSGGRVGTYEHWLTLSKVAAKSQPKAAKYSFDVERVDIRADNTAVNAGNGRWDWTVFIQADEAALSEVKSVEYTLHPTFANPIRNVTDRGTDRQKAFPLSANGWGTFEVAIKVIFKDGRAKYLRHHLRFGAESMEKK